MSRSICARRSKFLSTPSARRATECAFSGHRSGTISIHALREEGDAPDFHRMTVEEFISIPALREEGDEQYLELARHVVKFLSPPSARRATSEIQRTLAVENISIPALREEGDALPDDVIMLTDPFLSPPSARRATRLGAGGPLLRVVISIPALREEGDRFKRRQDVKLTIFLSPPSARRATRAVYAAAARSCYFYPRPPRGGRPRAAKWCAIIYGFLSPPSARRATFWAYV